MAEDKLDENGKPVPGEPTPAEKVEVKTPEDQELEKKAALKVELDEGIRLATEELTRIRSEKRQAKKDSKVEEPKEPEADPVIDRNDPNAKVWIKEIDDTVAPLSKQLEQEKAEVRQYAVDRFLQTRPALAKNPAKLKEMMGVYDRIHTSSERTQEGVTLDLEKAYAATFHKELLDAARQARIDNVRQDAIFSDIAVSRGTTSYSTPTPAKRVYSEDEKAILAKWGTNPDEHNALIEEQAKQNR